MTVKFEQQDEDGDVFVCDLSVIDLMYATKQGDSDNFDLYMLHRSGLASTLGVTPLLARRLLDDFAALLRRKESTGE